MAFCNLVEEIEWRVFGRNKEKDEIDRAAERIIAILRSGVEPIDLKEEETNKVLEFKSEKKDKNLEAIEIEENQNTVVLDNKELTRLLDPLGNDLQLFWNRSLDKFFKINDPTDYIILDPSSNAYNDAWNKWTIEFNVTFNWTYPDEELHDVHTYAESTFLSPSWLNVTRMYEVENDLIFMVRKILLQVLISVSFGIKSILPARSPEHRQAITHPLPELSTVIVS